MSPLSEAEFEEMFGVKLEPLDSNEPARNEKAPSAVKADGPTRITSPSAARGRRLTSTPATEIRMRSIQWLEQPLWQRSAFQLLAGPKGAGKGTYLAGLAGVRSRDGRGLPRFRSPIQLRVRDLRAAMGSRDAQDVVDRVVGRNGWRTPPILRSPSRSRIVCPSGSRKPEQQTRTSRMI